MNHTSGLHERLHFLADVVSREAQHLAQTDQRLFGPGLGIAEAAHLASNAELGERVDAIVARFGRLQDTLAGALLPRLLEALLEPVGSVLDNLNRAERLDWIRSASDWAERRLLRNRMGPSARAVRHRCSAIPEQGGVFLTLATRSVRRPRRSA